MARVHSDRIARIRKYNTFLRLENETIRPNIPLLFRLISNPQHHLPTPPPPQRPALPVQVLWQHLVQSSLTETNENR